MSAATHRRQRRRQLDALIDWHQARQPAGAMRIPITLTPAQLKRLLGQRPRLGSAHEFLYRGHTLGPMIPSARQALGLQQGVS